MPDTKCPQCGADWAKGRFFQAGDVFKNGYCTPCEKASAAALRAYYGPGVDAARVAEIIEQFVLDLKGQPQSFSVNDAVMRAVREQRAADEAKAAGLVEVMQCAAVTLNEKTAGSERVKLQQLEARAANMAAILSIALAAYRGDPPKERSE